MVRRVDTVGAGRVENPPLRTVHEIHIAIPGKRQIRFTPNVNLNIGMHLIVVPLQRYLIDEAVGGSASVGANTHIHLEND